MKKKNELGGKVYRAGAYVRLSKEDTDKDISDSITNQKDLIYDFLKGRAEIKLVDEFVDDGFSGVDFQRPAFLRLLREIEAGNIDCIVVKDLSRFGRNYIEAGRYLEQQFPDKNIRFIAINDGYDSISRSQSDSLIIPFRNLINDAYLRDISIKIRSQLHIKRQKGEFISPFAVYGYRKSSEDRHRLEIDDYAAGIVRDIFNWKLEGMSQQRIADRLNENGVLSPMDYKQHCGMNFKSGFQINSKSRWTAVTIGRILKNEIYTGVLAQGKKSTPNHKVKRLVDKPESEWVRINDNHDAIIPAEIFSAVNSVLKQDIRVAPNRETAYLFSGLLFCADCTMNLVRNGVKQKGREYAYYMCVSNKTDKSCTSHRISDNKLEETVLLVLRRHIVNLMDMESVLEYVNTLPVKRDELRQTDRLIVQKKEEVERYNRLKRKLHESLADGLIDKTEFSEMKRGYDEKLRHAEETLDRLKTEYNDLWETKGIHEWIEQFKKHRDISALTRPVVVTLIERIIVYQDRRIEVVFKYQYNYERVLDYICDVQTASGQAEYAEKEVV
jgi:DNA invertase Pin-like site-specific DNA recombinase